MRRGPARSSRSPASALPPWSASPTLLGEHVVPHGVARAPVEELRARALRERLERFQECACVVVQDALCPAGRDAGVVGERDHRNLSEHDQIVVPGQAQRRPFAHERRALVRPRPVADDVAETPELVEPAGVDLREHGLERMQVRVDVREDRNPHGGLVLAGWSFGEILNSAHGRELRP